MAATPKEKFEAAVNVIHSLPKHGSFQPSYAMMLSFYGLYKQATLGPCNISKPGFWDVIGKAKWDAWHRLGQMQQEVAMTQYVEELKKAIKRMSKDHAVKSGHSRKRVQLLFDGHPTASNSVKLSDADRELMEKIIETMPHTDNVQEFVERLGDFYEVVEDDTPIAQMVRNASPKHNSVPGRTNSLSALQDEAAEESASTPNGHDEDGNASSNSTGSSPLHVSQTASLDASHSTSAAASAAAGRRLNGPGEPTSDSGSDAEEFCDTYDVSHLQDDPVIRTSLSVLNSDPEIRLSNFDSASPSLPIAGKTQSQSSRTTAAGVSRPRHVDRVGMDGSQPTTTTTEVTSSADPLVLALNRLQQDMNSALVRLQAMETLFMAQKDALEKTRFNQRKPSKWRLFAGVNYPTIAFLISWPIVVHVVVRYMTRKRN